MEKKKVSYALGSNIYLSGGLVMEEEKKKIKNS